MWDVMPRATSRATFAPEIRKRTSGSSGPSSTTHANGSRLQAMRCSTVTIRGSGLPAYGPAMRTASTRSQRFFRYHRCNGSATARRSTSLHTENSKSVTSIVAVEKTLNVVDRYGKPDAALFVKARLRDADHLAR